MRPDVHSVTKASRSPAATQIAHFAVARPDPAISGCTGRGTMRPDQAPRSGEEPELWASGVVCDRMRGGFHQAVVLARRVEDNMQSSVDTAVSSPLQGSIPGPILGIESSCDETAAAVLDPNGHVLAEAVLSQQQDHAPFGGVVPEIAARAHLAHLPDLVRRVMARAGVEIGALAAIAATAGPGLIGGLIVGTQFGKGIAIAHRLPFIAANHLEAHALSARFPGLAGGGLAFPWLLLLASGGHCQCVAVEGVGQYRRLGATV